MGKVKEIKNYLQRDNKYSKQNDERKLHQVSPSVRNSNVAGALVRPATVPQKKWEMKLPSSSLYSRSKQTTQRSQIKILQTIEKDFLELGKTFEECTIVKSSDSSNESTMMQSEEPIETAKTEQYKVCELKVFKKNIHVTLQRESWVMTEMEFQKKLNKLAPKWSIEKNPKRGVLYAVQADDGKNWYRARIKSDESLFELVDVANCNIKPKL